MAEPITQIRIDLTALDANYAAWRRELADDCEICPVVKADAYGLGAVPIARRLAGLGVTTLAVYNMEQATELAAAGIGQTMLILMPVSALGRTDVLYRAAVADKLHLSVHSFEQLDAIEQIGTMFALRMPVHIEVDTGMARLGMSIDEADRMIADIARRRYIRLAGVYSHAAAPTDDEAYTAEQFEHFAMLLARHREALRHVRKHFAGTSAARRDRRHHMDMVRLGLGLFGFVDNGGNDFMIDPPVRPVLRWVSRIVHLQSIGAGRSVGYRRTYIADRPTRLGVVPVGHADGYPACLSNKSVVRVGPDLLEAPVRGQVNMDQITIDLTDLPSDIGMGSEVELIASESDAPNALPRLAQLAGTHCYDLLCRLSPRVQRQYTVRDAQTGRTGHVQTV